MPASVTIHTKLTTSGNSKAVRLPKDMLRQSGLKDSITLKVKDGHIIIGPSRRPRRDWDVQIKALIVRVHDPSTEFDDMKAADSDSLDDLPWDGPSFEEWQKNQ